MLTTTLCPYNSPPEGQEKGFSLWGGGVVEYCFAKVDVSDCGLSGHDLIELDRLMFLGQRPDGLIVLHAVLRCEDPLGIRWPQRQHYPSWFRLGGDCLLRYFKANRRLDSITLGDVEAWRTWLARYGNVREGKERKNKMVRSFVVVLIWLKQRFAGGLGKRVSFSLKRYSTSWLSQTRLQVWQQRSTAMSNVSSS